VENRRRIAILMTPPLLWLVLLFVVPMLIMAVFTFRAGTFGEQREVFTLDNYREFFANTDYHRLLLESIGVALVVSIFCIILSYPLAYFLAFRAGSLQYILLTILIVPAWTSYLLRILAWKVILGSGGLLNSFLLSAGLIAEGAPILLYSREAVIVALVYVWIPFVMLPIYSALQRINRSLLEAAADLGCAPWETFLRVTLPLSLPGVAAGFFFVFIPTLGEWVTPTLVGGVSGTMYGNIIQNLFVRANDWPLGSLMSLVMLVLVLIQIVIFVRLSPRGLSDLAGA
jgi:spermidine/putrescine transport system permease protein